MALFADAASFATSPPNTLWAALVALFGLGYLVRTIAEAIYDIYFRPLSKFPGPKLCAFSNIPHCAWFLGGRQPYKLLELHKKYGPVVRTAPNELSFNSVQSWKDIYGFRQGHKTFIKSDFYDGGSFAGRGVHSIVSERDVDAHGQMRRYLSHAFSDRSLTEQEDIVSTIIDAWVDGALKRGSQENGFNIGKGYEMMTFDIIGDLAFGETFGGVDTDVEHPWIAIALGALTQGALADALKRFPTLAMIATPLLRSKIKELTEDTRKNEDFAIDLIDRRIKRGSSRKDFMTRVLEQRDPDKVSDLQIAAHASDFVLAGSETTATALSAITYYLLRTPEAMRELQKEIRASFKTYSDIGSKSTLDLPYLGAVIQEGLRIYPPLPIALPRVVPEGGDTVDGHPLPAGVIVSSNPLAASLDPANFEDPEAFKPERWLGENQRDIRDASQPFSLGPRGCLGRNLGYMEMRTTLAKLFWKYDMELVNTELDWHRDSEMHTLWRKPALWVRLRERAE
ncbi:benzoate 4-monooxygenase cytochrome P450 [Lasiosphaeria hispida]|uniref:Benzoate 4-monooxygenase cytochrome P450 n=1 Tax=Lasiosphaeria hispida TaxID=260671 RepID=A0AAJ0H877_9PEZI|nr:benzoate 4-monooxygenase cytochrome P450 [Lasiosphaeria hispida]